MDVEVEAHPPERGRRSLILASGCCTSCCCCSCCLHSVGAIAGAAVGATLAAVASTPPTTLQASADPAGKLTVAPAAPAPVSRGAVVLSFWAFTAFITLLGLVLGSSDLEVTALTIAVLFPLILGLALLLLLPLAALAGGPGMKAWGKMLAGVAIGTTVGLGAMLLLGGVALAVFG